MRKILLYTAFLVFLCPAAFGVSWYFDENTSVQEVAPPMPKKILRGYRYFYASGLVFEGKKGTRVGCGTGDSAGDECRPSTKILQFIKLLNNKEYKNASYYYYENFLMKFNEDLPSLFYVRPYKNGIIGIGESMGHDGPSTLKLIYMALDKKGNLVTYQNPLYTETNYVGWNYKNLGIYSEFESDKFIPIPLQSYLFYSSFVDAPKPKIPNKAEVVFIADDKDGNIPYNYDQTLKTHKNSITWFKDINLEKFLDFNNKNYYIQAKLKNY